MCPTILIFTLWKCENRNRLAETNEGGEEARKTGPGLAWVAHSGTATPLLSLDIRNKLTMISYSSSMFLMVVPGTHDVERLANFPRGLSQVSLT